RQRGAVEPAIQCRCKCSLQPNFTTFSSSIQCRILEHSPDVECSPRFGPAELRQRLLRANHWQWRRRILGQRRLYSVKRCSVLVGSGGIGTDGITAEDGQVNRKYCFPVRKGREALDDPLLFTGLEGVSVRSTSYNGLD